MGLATQSPIRQHRESATVQAWLAAFPAISIVARDRGGGYGEAAAKALQHAVQVADRWHLMDNASRAFLDAVRKSMRQLRTVIGATTIDLKLLTAAECLQYEGSAGIDELGDHLVPPRRQHASKHCTQTVERVRRA